MSRHEIENDGEKKNRISDKIFELLLFIHVLNESLQKFMASFSYQIQFKEPWDQYTY